ncbi:ethanolamine utilization protein EutP [Aminipila butyrica]|uniref:Ethanolamine utilization protein EutP n=1 Tax=Aminipila butyrica TaxID=433296 RepID=A0A858BXR1_9FIRM|nr:EutP/PduV family microcompartment system protein [Aminipila butyrica]QIB70222.1 ethanolamine utilization protein EutP [Aminipila butyrica]
MRRKRVMVVGPTNCGKTTLVNTFNNNNGSLRKTPDLMYGAKTIDVPASYIENAWMYKHIIAAAQDASHVLILVDQSRPIEVYSPGFAKIFHCPVVGIISKCDLKPDNEEVCIKQLKRMGVLEPYFKVSIPRGLGLEALEKYLFENHDE